MRLVSNKAIVLEPLPVWPKDSHPRFFDAAPVIAEIARRAPGAQIVTSDSRFVEIPIEIVDDLIKWTLAAMRRVNFGFVPEARDCDKFAKALTFVFECCAAAAGIQAQALAARIHVHQVVTWGNVPAGGGHAICALQTTLGVQIVEPQNGTRCHLADYPNRGQIFRVLLGG